MILLEEDDRIIFEKKKEDCAFGFNFYAEIFLECKNVCPFRKTERRIVRHISRGFLGYRFSRLCREQCNGSFREISTKSHFTCVSQVRSFHDWVGKFVVRFATSLTRDG